MRLGSGMGGTAPGLGRGRPSGLGLPPSGVGDVSRAWGRDAVGVSVSRLKLRIAPAVGMGATHRVWGIAPEVRETLRDSERGGGRLGSSGVRVAVAPGVGDEGLHLGRGPCLGSANHEIQGTRLCWGRRERPPRLGMRGRAWGPEWGAAALEVRNRLRSGMALGLGILGAPRVAVSRLRCGKRACA